MIPLRDENPTMRTSFVTFFIIGINILVWIFIEGLGKPSVMAEAVCRYGLIAGELFGNAAQGSIIPVGANIGCSIDHAGAWQTLFTHMFMHGSWMHLIGNMWFLAVFGDNVEDSMGHLKFLFFYILCGLFAAFSQILADPQSVSPMVGASGAIGGVMGAYAVLYPRAPVHVLVILGFYIDRIILPAYLMLGYWFVLQVISALPVFGGHNSGVAFWAHIGGFAGGIIVLFLFKDKNRIELQRKAVFRRWGRM